MGMKPDAKRFMINSLEQVSNKHKNWVSGNSSQGSQSTSRTLLVASVSAIYFTAIRSPFPAFIDGNIIYQAIKYSHIYSSKYMIVYIRKYLLDIINKFMLVDI